MGQFDDAFDGIENAKTGFDSNFLREGRYRTVITAAKMTKKFNGDQFFAIEQKVTDVLEADGNNPHKVGEEVVHLIKRSMPGFLGMVKQFCAAALGCDEDEITKDRVARIISDEQPLAGMPVEWRGRQVQTKAGKDFTKVTYFTVDDESESEAA